MILFLKKSRKLRLLIVFVLFFFIGNAFSQRSGWIKALYIGYGFQLEKEVNGSGHGLLSDVGLLLKIGKSQMAAGVFAQSKFQTISGAFIPYKFYHTSNEYLNFYLKYKGSFHLILIPKM